MNADGETGTPNASMVAWILIQHKAQLGLRAAIGVSVFQCVNVRNDACMIFSIQLVHPRARPPSGALAFAESVLENMERNVSEKNIIREHTLGAVAV